MPLTGDSGASQEKVEKLAGPLLEEYLHIKVTNIQRVLAYKGDKQIFIRLGLLEILIL